MNLQRLAIIGAGDLGQQIAYYANIEGQFEVVGFFDDLRNSPDMVGQIPVLGKTNDIFKSFKKEQFDVLLIGVGYKHMAFRNKIFNQFKGYIPFARLIHSSCFIDPSSVIGEGVVMYPGCIIDHHVVVEQNVLLNVGCCISHHSLIGMHSFLSPRVAIAGFVTVEENCIIGINSTIIDNIKITKQTQIGGGSVVIKNIEKCGLYVGNPIRFIR
jgi:sugar O-acyltransferase (sialic acid O-acetyltransferase NeuD family)